MKELFRIFLEQNKDANQAVINILDKQPQEVLEEYRGSYYKSLGGLLRHILGAQVFFASLFKEALAQNAAASKSVALLTSIKVFNEELTKEQWKQCKASLAEADNALIALISELSENDFNAPVKINWFGGNPDSVPLSFLLQSLVLHNAHHRGQISQILDELKIDNDYSGISPAILQ